MANENVRFDWIDLLDTAVLLLLYLVQYCCPSCTAAVCCTKSREWTAAHNRCCTAVPTSVFECSSPVSQTSDYYCTPYMFETEYILHTYTCTLLLYRLHPSFHP